MSNRICIGVLEETALGGMEIEALIVRNRKVIVITKEYRIVKSNFNGTTSLVREYANNGRVFKTVVIGTSMEK